MSTKKSYREVKDNPALSYITQIQDKSESQHDDTVDLVETSTISENVPLQNVLTQAATVEVAPTPEGFRIKPQYSEIKSRRVQLVFPPSLFRKVQARAKSTHVSLNEFVCLVLEAVVHDDLDPESN